MAVRLVAFVGDRALRFAPGPGSHTVGSSTDSAIRLNHPTVSRNHALLEIGDEGVTLTDLGSRNGTRVDGRAVTAKVSLPPGSRVRIGSVELHVDEVGADDVEVGIKLPDADPDTPPMTPEVPCELSTVGPAALQSFALTRLPELAEAVARGDSHTEVAQAVGAALLQSLPCRRVEITSVDGGGVVYSGERSGSGEAGPCRADAGEGTVLAVEFRSGSFAEVYAPLVRAAAALVRAAARSPARPPVSAAGAGDAPRPPRPSSLDPEVRSIYAQAARVAVSRVSVLIRGESGTGKELLARFIHSASDRAAAALVTVNCAALPRDLLESELFGIEQGVATGVEARPGRFEAAHGGTLFLDEIGDMSLETQAKILRVLQEGEVYRLGGQRARPADVRVLSATNRDVGAMLAEGALRRDLYHRIADWVVTLPPLRDRRADIPNLAAHFLARACAELGVRAAGISRAALAALVSYAWPGNVRQLEKEMTRAALFVEDGELLDTLRLQDEIVSARRGHDGDRLKDVVEEAERDHIRRVLAACAGLVPEAADRLGIGVSTLYRRMKELGL